MSERPRLILAGRLPLRLRWILLGWIGAEIAVFVLLVHAIGFGDTILLGLATTVLGIMTMRRVGAGALLGLRRTLEGAQAPAGAMAEGMLAALGALLLILPGFLANAVGLALAAPSVRRRVIGFVGERPLTAPRRGPAGVVDLAPGEWRPVDRT